MPKMVVDEAYVDDRGIHVYCHRTYSKSEKMYSLVVVLMVLSIISLAIVEPSFINAARVALGL